MRIHQGDTVVIISGKDKGKTGTVLRTLESVGRLVVSDVNMRTKHVRSQPNRPGQIVKYEASISSSNVMIVDPKTKKRSRIGMTVDSKGKKKRIAKKSGDVLEVKAKAKATKAAVETKTEDPTSQKLRGASKKKDAKTAKGAKESKSPFWKKMGIGGEALAEADSKDAPAKGAKDNTVPDSGTSSTRQSHQRGN